MLQTVLDQPVHRVNPQQTSETVFPHKLPLERWGVQERFRIIVQGLKKKTSPALLC